MVMEPHAAQQLSHIGGYAAIVQVNDNILCLDP